MSRSQTLKLIAGLPKSSSWDTACVSGAFYQQLRRHGGGVPEFWGRDCKYHGGTEFLGTPKNHLDLVAKRPVSPHVFEIDGKSFHYKMPMGAVSSIANRATGVMLSVGAGAAAYVGLVGDLGAAIETFKQSYPLLVFPAKFAISFPLTYHTLGGLRHLYWDRYRYGNQADKSSPLEVAAVERSSRIILIGGAGLASVLAAWSL